MIKKILMIICIAISVTTKAQEYIPNLEVETLNAFESATTDTLTVRKQLISLLSTGTAPFIVSSTNKVVNLNVDRLDSMSSEDFPLKTTANVYSGIQSYSTGFTFDNDRQIVDKSYVDAVATGNMPKLPVDVATTTNITLSGIQTIDSYLVSEGQEVLVNNQSTQSENGVYIVDSATWVRSSDLDTWVELYKAYVAVLNGGQSGSSFVCNIPSTGTLELDPITWVLYTSSTNIMAGDGLTKIGNTLSANYGGTGTAITISRSDHTQNFSTITNTPTLTINGTGYDLSSNRTWNVGTVTSISAGLGLSGGMITSSGTILLDTASTSVLSRQRAANTYQPIGSYLTSEVDGSTTNEIQDLTRSNDTLYLSLDATPVVLNDFQKDSDTLTFDATLSDLADSSTAIRAFANTKAVVSGTDNYIMKKTGANTLGNSSITDNGSLVSSTLPIRSLGGFSGIGSNQVLLYGQNTSGALDEKYWFPISFNGNTMTSYIANDAVNAATVISQTKRVGNTIESTCYPNGVFGFGTLTPAARIHSQSTGTQARLGYDANKYTDLTTNSAGTFNISPSGGFTNFSGGISATAFSTFSGQVEMTGVDVNFGASTVLRKNGSDIFTAPITMGACGSAGQVLTSTGINSAPTWTTPATGSGSGITSIGIQVPTGLTVSPASLTANGTFTFGLQSGYSIPTTANQTNWSTAYSQRLISVSASYPLYLSLTNNVLTGYLHQRLVDFANANQSTGYLYWNGSSYSYQAATTTYTLPTASNSTLGGVQVSSTDGGLAMSGNYILQKDNVLTARTPVLSDPIAFYDASATAQGQTTFAEIRTIMNGVQTLTSSTSITMDYATAPKASLSLAHNATLTITNLPDGGEGSIEVTSSGAYTLAIAGSTGYTSVQKMGTTTSIANNSHTTVFYWRTGSTLYYGYLLNN